MKGLPGSIEWGKTYQMLSGSIRQAYETRFARRYHRELDKCHGDCLLRSTSFAHVVLDAMRFWHGAKGAVGDIVIMPNHVHALATPVDGVDIGEWMGRVKRFASRQINAGIDRPKSGLWQSETYDHIVRDRNELARIRRYIRDNPQHSKLSVGSYLYTKAQWMDDWCGMEPMSLRPDKSAVWLRRSSV